MERNQRPIENSVGDLISNVYGAELAQFCHFGKESSIMHLLIKNLMALEMDLRAIFGGVPIYDTARHIRKLGLHRALAGLCTPGASKKPDKFLKGFVFKSQSTAVMSEGLGVNMWAILLMASLIGSDEIHCKSSSRVATSLLGLILGLAPSAATPGNLIPVRSFDERSREPEVVVVTAQNRCEHFLRPIEDDNLAINGTFTYCQVDRNRFVPEDYLGCAYILEMSKFLKCKYEEVPPKHVMGYYQLMQDRYYPVYRHPVDGAEKADGTLLIDKHGVHVMCTTDSEGTVASTFTYLEWHEKLKERGLLVMPVVWRSGALVHVGEDGDVGCLVPTGTKNSMQRDGVEIADNAFVSNYDHIGMCYHALTDDDTMVDMSVISTLDSLVVPGTVLWIKSDTTSWDKLKPKFPQSRLPDSEANARMVQVRLNIPVDTVRLLGLGAECAGRRLILCVLQDPTPGEVYVTVMQRQAFALHSHDATYRHITVSPWELSSVAPPGPMRIKYLWL
jgi:hypothetical protein